MSLIEKITSIFRKKKSIRYNPIFEDFSDEYNRDGDIRETFYLNLAKTIIYTQSIVNTIQDVSNVNYAKILRSVNPIYNSKSFYIFFDTSEGTVVNSGNFPFNYNTILHEGLSVRIETNLPKGDLKTAGKILEFDLDITTYDGAAAAASGFVDEGDIPPLDTWFYVTKTKLYCWIPAMFVNKIEDAIAVEIFGSYRWLEETDPFFYTEIFKKLEEMR